MRDTQKSAPDLMIAHNHNDAAGDLEAEKTVGSSCCMLHSQNVRNVCGDV